MKTRKQKEEIAWSRAQSLKYWTHEHLNRVDCYVLIQKRYWELMDGGPSSEESYEEFMCDYFQQRSLREHKMVRSVKWLMNNKKFDLVDYSARELISETMLRLLADGQLGLIDPVESGE